jgi:hypothetical protein
VASIRQNHEAVLMKLVIPANENELINNFFDEDALSADSPKDRSYEIQCKILSINKLIK